MKIDIGCGPKKQEGYIGLDSHDYTDIYSDDFLVWDLEKGALPFWTNTIEALYADNVLEHITNLIPLMNECWRVLKKGGEFEIIVPMAGTEGAVKDPTHVRHFNRKTFDYFVKSLRQENYGIKPWIIAKENVTPGRIEITLTPDK